MTRLSWETPGSRIYETGVDRGVIYPKKTTPISWSGLVSVNEAPSDSVITTNYYDGQTFASLHTPDSFSATVEAFTYPSYLDERKSFGMSYRTLIGNDLQGSDHGYRIHLVYNALATPNAKQYSSIAEQPDNGTFTWGLTTKPIAYPGLNPSAHLYIDTTQAYSSTVSALEDVLYGTEVTAPSLPLPLDVLALFDANSILKITDHGDGTWTAEGPDDVVSMLDSTTFQIDWPSVVFITNDEYSVYSL